MNAIVFSKSADISEAKKDTVEQFHSLVRQELLEETVLETEHIKELHEIEDFLPVLVDTIRFVLRLNEFYDGFVVLIRYAHWKKSQVIKYDFIDDSPLPLKSDYQRLTSICNGIYSSSGLVEVINKSASLAEINSIVSLLIDLQFVIRTARTENCWTELKSLMIQLIDRKIL